MPALMIGGSAIIGVGSSIFSGIMGKSAAKKQEEAIRQAQQKATETRGRSLGTCQTSGSRRPKASGCERGEAVRSSNTECRGIAESLAEVG